MTLRLVYRLYGGENRKGRPEYYSKLTCLASFMRAAEAANAEVVVLADGPISDELRALAERGGQVVDLPGGPIGMRGSFVAAIQTPDRFSWPADDVVYFSEDDYLHRVDSLAALAAAAEHLDRASYFALYASTPAHPAVAPGATFEIPKDWLERPEAVIDGVRWVNVPSTASTFGARVGALRADLGIIRQGMIPYPTRFLDHEMCLVYQGRFPYTAKELFVGRADTNFRSGIKAFASNVFLTPFRVAYQLRALTRRRHPHPLYAADPNLASHMESELLSAGTDWARVAAEADAWAVASGKGASGTR